MSSRRAHAQGRRAQRIARWAIAPVGAFALGWLVWAAVSWARYDRGARTASDSDAVRRFMPDHEVDELFQTRIRAPASITISVAESMSLDASPIIRAIFRAREFLLGGTAAR